MELMFLWGQIKKKINKYSMFACYEVIIVMEIKIGKNVRSMGMEYKSGVYRDNFIEKVKFM